MPLPIVLVVDTGVDDALALIVASRHPRLDLRGVVCTAGNVPLCRVRENTAYVLDVLGVDVPLAAGADRRLDGSPFAVRDVHGPDGLAGLAPTSVDLPVLSPPPAAFLPADAVVVSLGPLTSIVTMPARRIVASYASAGEANHGQDPVAGTEAVRKVEHLTVSSNIVRPEAVADLQGTDDPLARLAAGLLEHQARRPTGLGDASVVLTLAEPDLDPAEHVERLVALVVGRPLGRRPSAGKEN